MLFRSAMATPGPSTRKQAPFINFADTDDDLPDLAALVASSPPGVSAIQIPPSSDVPVARVIRSRRPAALYDSDDL